MITYQLVIIFQCGPLIEPTVHMVQLAHVKTKSASVTGTLPALICTRTTVWHARKKPMKNNVMKSNTKHSSIDHKLLNIYI